MTENITINRDEPNISISEPMREYHLPIASETVLGGIKVGNNLTITEDGVLSAESTEYTLPVATESDLGGVKVGSNLSISDGVLTADVDSVLSSAASATNPVQNKVIASALNALETTTDSLDDRLDTVEGNYSDITTDIEEITEDITNLENSYNTLSDAVETNTNDIETNTTNIGTNTSDISDLDGRLDTAEGNITDIQGDITDINNTLTDLDNIVEATIEYTELLPAATWTSGQLDLHRRGLLGFLFMNLEGSFLLGANSSTTIYVFQTPSNIPLYTTSATVLTDVGNIVLEVTDQGEVNLSNPSASALTITKIYGNVPLVY